MPCSESNDCTPTHTMFDVTVTVTVIVIITAVADVTGGSDATAVNVIYIH